MKLKIGDKVLMSRSIAKFNLDHPEHYFWADGTKGPSSGYNEVMQMSMAVLLDVPMTGEITGHGADSNTYRVNFESPFGSDYSYYESKDLIKVTK